MLEKIDLTKKMDREEYKQRMKELEASLGRLQRECKDLNIPVMIAFEGYDAAGKGRQISELIHALDPRGFEVHAVKKETEDEAMHPFMWRFWTKLPARGRIALYDTSWYRKVLVERFEGNTRGKDTRNAYHSIRAFEQQLTDDGMVMIKLFLAIDKKEQKKRFKKLMESKETAWRVSKQDLERNKQFQRYIEINEEMLQETDTDYAPWTIIEANDRRFATAKIYTTVINAMAEGVERVKNAEISDNKGRTNREKWDQYEVAVNEMLIRTSTPKAPWVVVEGNSKYYARVKVLQTVVDAIEARLKED